MDNKRRFRRAEALADGGARRLCARNGSTYTAFGDGDHVMLAGFRRASPRGFTGHSDADVALHALVTPSSALAEGDIGVHFPPAISMARRFVRTVSLHLLASGSVRAPG